MLPVFDAPASVAVGFLQAVGLDIILAGQYEDGIALRCVGRYAGKFGTRVEMIVKAAVVGDNVHRTIGGRDDPVQGPVQGNAGCELDLVSERAGRQHIAPLFLKAATQSDR